VMTACQRILESATALAVDVEFLAGDEPRLSVRQAVAGDARVSVMRLARLVRELQDAARRDSSRAA